MKNSRPAAAVVLLPLSVAPPLVDTTGTQVFFMSVVRGTRTFEGHRTWTSSYDNFVHDSRRDHRTAVIEPFAENQPHNSSPHVHR